MDEPARECVSIVIPCYHEERVLPALRARLVPVVERLAERHDVEVVFVDDGSRDGTWEQIQAYARDDGRVRGVRLSRNFGHQIAVTCGYDFARGDAVVSIDADLQDPPEVIPRMVDEWRAGADVVYAVRSSRAGEPRWKLWSTALFYRFVGMISPTYAGRNAGDFRLLGRRALQALSAMRESHRFIRGMVGWVGFETVEVFYEREPRAAGKTKYSLRKLAVLAVDGAVSCSTFPLRLTFVFAGLMSLVVLSYLGYVGVRYAFFGAELPTGWTSLLLSVMAFGALNLVCIGIMGEYVGRIYEQVKDRPLYFVSERAAGDPAAARDEEARA